MAPSAGAGARNRVAGRVDRCRLRPPVGVAIHRSRTASDRRSRAMDRVAGRRGVRHPGPRRCRGCLRVHGVARRHSPRRFSRPDRERCYGPFAEGGSRCAGAGSGTVIRDFSDLDWIVRRVDAAGAVSRYPRSRADGSGWFDGYYDAANSLRIAKSYLLALLMLPPLLAQMRRSGMRAIRALAAGLTTGLLLASLAILWERLTFPGLLNFSSDYRVTAQFWEMHVGGAALDGFLALTLPFAIFELLAGRNRGRSLLAGGTVMLAGYACLVTFSRGVYLAVPVSLMLLAMLLARRRNSWSLARAARTLGQGCLLALAMAAMSYLTFRSGGYRALLAVLGVFAASLPLAAPARGLPASRWIVALAAGVLLAAAGSLVASLLSKGVYLMYGLAFAGCALSLLQLRRSSSSAVAIAALAAYVWLDHRRCAGRVELGWRACAAGHGAGPGGADRAHDLERAIPDRSVAARPADASSRHRHGGIDRRHRGGVQRRRVHVGTLRIQRAGRGGAHAALARRHRHVEHAHGMAAGCRRGTLPGNLPVQRRRPRVPWQLENRRTRGQALPDTFRAPARRKLRRDVSRDTTGTGHARRPIFHRSRRARARVYAIAPRVVPKAPSLRRRMHDCQAEDRCRRRGLAKIRRPVRRCEARR